MGIGGENAGKDVLRTAGVVPGMPLDQAEPVVSEPRRRSARDEDNDRPGAGVVPGMLDDEEEEEERERSWAGVVPGMLDQERETWAGVVPEQLVQQAVRDKTNWPSMGLDELEPIREDMAGEKAFWDGQADSLGDEIMVMDPNDPMYNYKQAERNRAFGIADELGRDIEEMDAAIEKRGRWAGVVPGSLLKPRVGVVPGALLKPRAGVVPDMELEDAAKVPEIEVTRIGAPDEANWENMSVEELEDLKTRKEEESGYWWEMAGSYGRQFVASPGANMLDDSNQEGYNHALETATGLDNEIKDIDAVIEKRGRWAGVVPGSLLKPRVGVVPGALLKPRAGVVPDMELEDAAKVPEIEITRMGMPDEANWENMSVEELEDLKTRKEEESGYWWEMAGSYGRQFVASPGANMLDDSNQESYNHALETATGLDTEIKDIDGIIAMKTTDGAAGMEEFETVTIHGGDGYDYTIDKPLNQDVNAQAIDEVVSITLNQPGGWTEAFKEGIGNGTAEVQIRDYNELELDDNGALALYLKEQEERNGAVSTDYNLIKILLNPKSAGSWLVGQLVKLLFPKEDDSYEDDSNEYFTPEDYAESSAESAAKELLGNPSIEGGLRGTVGNLLENKILQLLFNSIDQFHNRDKEIIGGNYIETEVMFWKYNKGSYNIIVSNMRLVEQDGTYVCDPTDPLCYATVEPSN